MRAALPALLVLALLAACGQKGPLYLRDQPPANQRPPKADPFKPVPYPKEADEESGAKK
ncbi:MAG: lipoprotein [Burkholderiales bacterium]|nr:lipoprotein [Burkholderiales bacterium]